MKKNIKYIAIAILIVTSTFSIQSISAKSESDKWMVGGEMATTWTWPSLFSGIHRDLCCVDSEEENACNLNSQSNIQLCRAGRDNDAFIWVFRK